MECVVDVTKVIRKCGISYRGDQEAAFSLKNMAVNHGNILGIILLLSKYDVCHQQHVIS